jgi:hypothetical protein
MMNETTTTTTTTTMSSYEIYNANPLSIIIVFGAMMVTPFYVLLTYVGSSTSTSSFKTGAGFGTLILVWGSIMAWFCLADVINKLGDWGNLIIPLLWFGQSVIVLLFRKPLLQRHVLSQKLLV